MAFPSLLKFLIRGSSSGRLLSFTTFHAFGGIRIFPRRKSLVVPPVSSSDLELDRDLDEFEFEFEFEFRDRDLSLPLSGAPGGDEGVLDPMSLPGAADDLDGLLDDDLDGDKYGDISRPRSRSRSAAVNPPCRRYSKPKSLCSLVRRDRVRCAIGPETHLEGDLDALLEGDLDALLEGDLGLTISLYLLPGKKCIVSIER